jgi:hypothetical protein
MTRWTTCVLLLAVLLPMSGLHAAQSATSTGELHIGVAETDITPPPGFPMAGYFHERLATGTTDPLKAKAIVLRSESQQAAIVICDLTGIAVDLAQAVRREAAARTGIPFEHIAVSATHSHTAPDYTHALYSYLTGTPAPRSRSVPPATESAPAAPPLPASQRQAYVASLIENIVLAIDHAHRSAAPAAVSSGIVEQQTPVSFNRRFVQRDGSVRTWVGLDHEGSVRSAGPIDPEIGLLLVSDKSGSPRCLFSNFALHLDTVGGTQWSGDYPYFIEQSVRSALGTGVISLFGTGCCGDINHVNPRGKERNTTDVIGQSLGQTITSGLQHLTPVENSTLQVRAATVPVPLESVTAEEVQQALRTMTAVAAGESVDFLQHVTAHKKLIVDQLRNKPRLAGDDEPSRDLARRQTHIWAGVGSAVPVDLLAVTIGHDVAIVCLPGEVFVELGLAIKRASPFRTTIIVELTNCVETCYIPTRAAYAGGSYEVTNCSVAPGAGELLVEETLKLLRSAAAAPQPTTTATVEPTSAAPCGIDETSKQEERTVEEFLYRAKGTVHRPDGTIATDARILPWPEGSDIVSATIKDGVFEVVSRALRGRANLGFRAADDSQIGIWWIDSEKARGLNGNPIRVDLQETRKVRVKVIDRETQLPVPGASVSVEPSRYQLTASATTDSGGFAEFNIPAKSMLYSLHAWTDDNRYAGLIPSRRRDGSEWQSELQLEVSHGEPMHILAVDETGMPIPNLPLTLTACGGEFAEEYLYETPQGRQTTNEQGRAVFPLLPKFNKPPTVWIQPDKSESWIETARKEPTSPDDPTVVTFRRQTKEDRVRVTGTISSTDAPVAGLLIQLYSFSGRDEGRSDVAVARTTTDGTFEADVLPGRFYTVFVEDLEYVSGYWDGVIAGPDGQVLQRPQLNISRGIPVTIKVTGGPDRKPLSKAWVLVESPHDFRYKGENGAYRNGCVGRRMYEHSNEAGLVKDLAAPGPLRVSVSVGEWSVEQKAIVVPGEPLTLEFHKEVADDVLLTGQLVAPAGQTVDMTHAQIEVRSLDGESSDRREVQADANGRFETRLQSTRIGILARTADDRFVGTLIVDSVSQQPVSVPLSETTTFAGRVVDSAGSGVGGTEVSLSATFVDREGPTPPAPALPIKPSIPLFRDRTVTTDANGYFEFSNVPHHMVLTCEVARVDGRHDGAYGEAYLEPGEVRPPEILKLSSIQSDQPRRRLPLSRLVDWDVEISSYIDTHALLVLDGGGDASMKFVNRELLDTDSMRDVDWYWDRHFVMDEHLTDVDRDYMKSRNWPVPEPGSLLLVVIDVAGNEVSRMQLTVGDDLESLRQSAAGFLAAWKLPQKDARAMLNDALAEAKRTGRNVWIRRTQTRCAPCIDLSMWMKKQEELLSKDLILVKFDDVRDLHGIELCHELNFGRYGVPCHSILNADGAVLATSIGPLGNIGCPDASPESSGHLRKMLKAAAIRMTDDDIEQIIQSLPKD